MKKTGILAMILTFFLLLTGCGKTGGTAMDQALQFRAALLAAKGCSFFAKITADYGEKVYTFGMDCEADGEGNVRFRVTEPASIAGITGKLTGETGVLTFDDAALEFGLLADGQISPVTAPFAVVQSWRVGYITACSREEDGLRLTVDGSFEKNPMTVDSWLDAEKKVPFHTEVCYNDKRILTLELTNFQLT